MSIFDWDDENINHIARHGVKPEEAEQVIENEPLERDTYIVDGERRFDEIGETNSGRMLVVVSIVRNQKFRVVTAFDAPRNLKMLYLNSKVNS